MPGRSAASSRTPAATASESSGCRARRESGVPWTYSTGTPPGSPRSSSATRRPSGSSTIRSGSGSAGSAMGARPGARRPMRSIGDEPEAARRPKGSRGAKENRTPDLFHAMEALYQLSYSPRGVRIAERRGYITSRPPAEIGPPAVRNRNRTLRGSSVRCLAMPADTAPTDVVDGRVPAYDPQSVEAKWQAAVARTRAPTRSTTTTRARSSTCCACTRTRRVRRTWATCGTTRSAT